jgi:hypothetical protein
MAKLKLITMRSSYAKVHIFNKQANVKLFEELIRALQKLFLKSQNLSEKWKNRSSHFASPNGKTKIIDQCERLKHQEDILKYRFAFSGMLPSEQKKR